MPQYCFRCESPDHRDASTRDFDRFVFMSKEDLKAGRDCNRYACPECGGTAKRNLAGEIPSQSVIGVKPVSDSTTGPGSLKHEAQFAFGNGKGEVPFKDSGEYDKFLNGKNELGPPALDDNGNRLRKPDGSIVHTGEKFVKLGKNVTPKPFMRPGGGAVPRANVPDAWIDSKDLGVSSPAGRDFNPQNSARNIPAFRGVPFHRSPIRKAK